MGIGMGAADGMGVVGTAVTADGMAGTADGTAADSAACTAAAARGAMVAGWGDMDTETLSVDEPVPASVATVTRLQRARRFLALR